MQEFDKDTYSKVDGETGKSKSVNAKVFSVRRLVLPWLKSYNTD